MQMSKVMSIHLFQGSHKTYIYRLLTQTHTHTHLHIPPGSHRFTILEDSSKVDTANCCLIFIAAMHLNHYRSANVVG